MMHGGDRTTMRLVVYSDFRSPWGYLASRRLERLSAAGVDVDWRAITCEAPSHDGAAYGSDGLGRVHAQMEAVVATLLPEENLPFALAGFVPETTAAVAAYAESYRMGMSTRVRPLLFEALWLHGFDLGDDRQVHTLLTDVWHQGPSPEDQRGVGGVPANQLIQRWRSEHASLGLGTFTMVCGSAEVLVDSEAVAWLGEALQQCPSTVAH